MISWPIRGSRVYLCIYFLLRLEIPKCINHSRGVRSIRQGRAPQLISCVNLTRFGKTHNDESYNATSARERGHTDSAMPAQINVQVK